MRDQFHEVVDCLSLESFVEADPERREPFVQQVERDASHAFKLRFIDIRIEIRIDGGLRNTETDRRVQTAFAELWLLSVPSSCRAGNPTTQEPQAVQLISWCTGRRSLGHEEEQEWEQNARSMGEIIRYVAFCG